MSNEWRVQKVEAYFQQKEELGKKVDFLAKSQAESAVKIVANEVYTAKF
jgi:hypothetical protein